MKATLVFKGGVGSGNHGHSGRPGKVGGSGGGSGSSGEGVSFNAFMKFTGNNEAASYIAANTVRRVQQGVDPSAAYLDSVEDENIRGDDRLSKTIRHSALAALRNLTAIKIPMKLAK